MSINRWMDKEDVIYCKELCVCAVFVLSCFSCVWLFATPWTVACQAPLSVGFSWQEYWSGLAFPPPGHLTHLTLGHLTRPRDLTHSSCVSCIAGRFFTTKPPGKPRECQSGYQKNLYMERLTDFLRVTKLLQSHQSFNIDLRCLLLLTWSRCLGRYF